MFEQYYTTIGPIYTYFYNCSECYETKRNEAKLTQFLLPSFNVKY